MKKLILLVLIMPGLALGYFEINDDVPGVFSPDGSEKWLLWSGQDAANSLFDDSFGILFDEILFTVIIGNFTPGASRTRHTAVGVDAGRGFTGDSTTSVGLAAGENNTGTFHTAIGVLAGKNNEGALNTALGGDSFNAFTLDTGNAKNLTSIDPANNRVTVSGGHGFGATGTFRNLKTSTTDTLPAGLEPGAILTWEIISSTILECRTDSFTDAGTGTHTLTPQFIYTNSTAVGDNAEPDASNQVMLGATNVTEVKTSGAINAGGGLTLGGNLIIPDDGLIGSVSDPDAIQVEADGDVVMSQDLTVDGTISDGTATLTGGNYSSVGTITSGDITILDPTPILVFRDNDSLGAASVGFIEWRDSGGGRAGFLGNNSSGNDDLFWKNEQGGNIGIQTTGAGKLQIFADVEMNGSLTVDTDTLVVNAVNHRVSIGIASGQRVLRVENNSASVATMGISNLHATGFAGLEYLDELGNESVFTGFRNSTHEFRFNNTASGGHILFMIGTDERLRIATGTDGQVVVTNDAGNAALQIRNKEVGGFSGIGYQNTSGAERVFSGFRTTTGEFRFNNIAASGHILLMIDGNSKLTIANSGSIGFGEDSPETLTEWTGTAPYLTLHNSTEENSDGGRESRLNFKGEQGAPSAGTETTLARIEVSHDGSADDEKGKFVISVNDGDDGDTPTARFTIDAAGVTRIGDGTNETRFSSTGVRTMIGTARVLRSVDFEPDAVKKGGIGPADSTEDDFPIHDYDSTNDESVHIHWEIPHWYASAGEIHIHVEFFVDTAPVSAANVTWGVEYKKLSIGDNFDFGTGTTTVIVNTALTTGTPANDTKIHSSAEIHLTTTGFAPMDVVLIRIFRDANASEAGATDNFGSDARVFNYHLMALSDKPGQGS